jgi:hypothetical protein
MVQSLMWQKHLQIEIVNLNKNMHIMMKLKKIQQTYSHELSLNYYNSSN